MLSTYAELHCKTNFSFLCGASHAEELAARAAELGYHALAITDQNTLAGVVRAHGAAKTVGLKLLIGAEIIPIDGPPLLLYAMSFAGYRRLAHLITCGRRAAPKGECRLTVQDVAEHAENLLAVCPASLPRKRGEEAQEGSTPPAHAGGSLIYRDLFAGRYYFAAALHCDGNDHTRLQQIADQAHALDLPLVATNDVHYHIAERRPLHDVLTAIKHGTTVAQLGALRFPNGERHLKAAAEMAQLFARHPEAIAHTIEIADRCNFSLDELRYEYPEELSPPGMTPMTHLVNLTWAGAHKRYPAGIPDKIRALLQKELTLIEELHYEAFFLTVWDLVEFARGRGILCQGRGSAANSAVCYCLGITSVNPSQIDLLFERFISKERDEAPDIDVDFEHERREEVLQYIYEKYGRDRAGIVAEVISYRPRSAVRDVGKALGLSLDAVNRLSKVFDPYGDEDEMPQRIREAGLNPNAPNMRQLIGLATSLLGFPRHLSQHVGGFVITRGPLSELVPIENAAMEGRTVVQWDKYDVETLGILKVDCLSLGMLTAIRKCFDLLGEVIPPAPKIKIEDLEDDCAPLTLPPVEDEVPRKLTLATIPQRDSVVYDMICRADTIGVFQIESRAQMSMLPRLKPRNYYHLVIEVAIVRPGPIQGGMVHPFLRRRNGEEDVTYPSDEVKEVLKKTLGVPLFQEQVMKLAEVAAGFTPGEADQLRRAMGAWRKTGVIDKFRQKLKDGMIQRNLSPEFADQLYEQIRGFGEYGFPEAHAASFALLAYVSAWLKCHYPAHFAAALLNSQPMGFYAPAQIVRDLQDHDIEVWPVDVNHSDWDCTLEPAACGLAKPAKPQAAMRLGLRLINGLPEAAGRALEAHRPFRSISELARRLHIGRPILARLAAADAFASLGLSRREALWQVLALGEDLPLFADLADDEPTPTLPVMPLGRQVTADYQTVGLSLKAHPIGLLRPELERLQVLPSAALNEIDDKKTVRVAGLVLMRQRPATAKGTIFMTLEDETGIVNLVVWPRVWERFRAIARGATALLVQGKLERTSNGSVIHVMASKFEDLSQALLGLATKSRDFH